jgi:RND family efflux transporter MFP subunit
VTVRTVLVLVCAALVSGLLRAATAPAQDATGPAFTVEVEMIDDLKAVFGTVESVDTTLARSRIGGILRGLAVDEGSRVEEGQALARVVDEKLGLELAALDSRIRAAQSQLKLARIGLDRISTLRAKGTVSQSALDDAQTAVEVEDGAVAALQAERAVIAERRAEGAVLAPAAGRVLQVRVTDGQVVLPGEVVAEIADEAYVLRLYLPERHARFLHQGDKVLVGERGLAPAATGLREGRIRQVYPELDHGRVVADVAVDGLGDYFVGERTRVFVATGERPAVVIPRRYLASHHGVAYVRLERGGDVVVQPGLPMNDRIEILSGLQPGDRLVLPGAAAAAGSDGSGG